MALLRIYETPDPVLRQISTPVEAVDDDLRAFIADMFETMYDAPGIGLAAVQVGVPKRLLVMDLQEPEDPDDPESPAVKEPRVFINPEVLWASETSVPYTEGCLSVPDQYAEVLRPDRLRARWLDEAGPGARAGSRRPAGRFACSTRWTISKACCSSTICRS